MRPGSFPVVTTKLNFAGDFTLGGKRREVNEIIRLEVDIGHIVKTLWYL